MIDEEMDILESSDIGRAPRFPSRWWILPGLIGGALIWIVGGALVLSWWAW